MPRESTFTKDEIVQAAFEVFAREGMAAISARRVALQLNCSTAPVYTAFGSMNDLKNMLLARALELLLAFTQRNYTHNIFLNIGVGMLEFAKQYRLIYRTLFLEDNTYEHILKEYNRQNLLQMKKEMHLGLFSDEELKSILFKLTVYTHGLAALICADMLEHSSLKQLIETLHDVGENIIGATAHRAGKLEEYMKCGGEEVEKH